MKVHTEVTLVGEGSELSNAMQQFDINRPAIAIVIVLQLLQCDQQSHTIR